MSFPMGPSEHDPSTADAAGAPDAGPHGHGSRGARARRVVATLVLLSLAVGGVAVGLQQRQVAAEWRDRAVALEQQRDDAIGRAEALNAQLDELGTLVQLSVDDLATLEERLAELAGEKARAEDRATVTRAELTALAAQVDRAFSLLNQCVDDLFDLQRDTIAAFNRAVAGERVDVGPLNDRLAATAERCTTARQAGANAVANASRLR
jgi:uncharacterized coiled-coil protein SlyX